MRKLLGIFVLVFAAACGSDGRASLCDTQDPRPVECDQECDPDAVQSECPEGFFCSSAGTCDAECTPNSDECGSGYFCSEFGQCLVDGSCVGLECSIVDCAEMGLPSTTISGTVFAPNGTLPLFGVSVYIPNLDPGPLADGAICERCGQLPGIPVAEATSDESGNFTLANVPTGADIPVVIVTGKWRRQITIPAITECTDNALTAADTRLPRTTSEGDMPKIAISTGGADALECLPRKLGIADSEITTAGQGGALHLFTNSDSGGTGASNFAGGFGGGSGDFAESTTALWNSVDNLRTYDIVFLSCEGQQHPASKPQSSMDALKAYADLGGRVFTSHWHNIWIGGEDGNQSHGIPDWQAVANFRFGGNPNPDDLTATIDEVGNPKGQSFASWMLNVGGSTTRGLIDEVSESRTTCASIDNTKAERWVYLDPPTANGNSSVMNFQFFTPQNVSSNDQCGKVVFSDMHVSADSGSSPGTPYPEDCADSDLTDQEKALAFMFFDLAACISGTVD